MNDAMLNKSIKERLEAGSEIIALTFDGTRTHMVQVTGIDDDGNKDLKLLGSCPDVIGLN